MNAPSSNHGAGSKSSSREELRQQLFELDNRFGLLGGAGLFDTLDQAGVLGHRIEQVGDIEYAMTHPPLVGRARLRGDFVRDCSAKAGAYACDWMQVRDGVAGRQASLKDPFCESLEWRESPGQNSRPAPNPERVLGERLRHIRQLCESGSYARALAALDEVLPRLPLSPPALVEELLSLSAFLRSRCGLGGGVEALADLVHRRPTTLAVASLGLQVHLHLGLVPHPGAAQWLQQGEQLLADTPTPPARVCAAFLTAKAAFLNRSGHAPDALICLARALPLVQGDPAARCLTACVFAELGEGHRLLGNRREALGFLRQARQVQTAIGSNGELGHRTLLFRSKLERSPSLARFWLGQAERLFQASSDRVGLLKTWLLLARFSSDVSASQRLRGAIDALRLQLPAIDSCPKLGQILEHWTDWCEGKPPPDQNSDFFWNI